MPQALILQDSRIQTPVFCSTVGSTTVVPTAPRKSCVDTYFQEGWGESTSNATTESSSQEVWTLGKDNENNARFAGHLCDRYKSDEYRSVQGNLPIHDRWAPTPLQYSSESQYLNHLDLIQFLLLPPGQEEGEKHSAILNTNQNKITFDHESWPSIFAQQWSQEEELWKRIRNFLPFFHIPALKVLSCCWQKWKSGLDEPSGDTQRHQSSAGPLPMPHRSSKPWKAAELPPCCSSAPYPKSHVPSSVLPSQCVSTMPTGPYLLYLQPV